MKVTSAEANKMIRQLRDQKELLFTQEKNVISFVAATTENVEEVRPAYSYEEMAEQTGDSRNQIHRYIRLTHLLPGLLDLVDDGRIAFTVGVELSYLTIEEQRVVLDTIALYDCTPSYSQACRMHRESEAGGVHNRIEAILAEEKPNQREKVSFQYEQLRRYFPSDYTPKQMTESILQLLERERRRRLDRGAR